MEANGENIKKYPVGIQTFKELIEGGYVYIDKTPYIKMLIDEGKYYFLARPRRFGKSLLLSTIESFYSGEKTLFKGLALAPYIDERNPNPVLHLDLNNGSYSSVSDLHYVLDMNLKEWEKKYGIIAVSDMLSLRFGEVIKAIFNTTGRKVVILVDEYDKPMLSTVHKRELADDFRDILKSFYSNLKTMDRYIEFAMLSGVAKFSKVSIFSDLNNLRDISFEDKFSAICGITNDEIERYFSEGVEHLSYRLGLSETELREEIRNKYDGYHFSSNSEDIYNPFSLMSLFAKMKFGNYWAESGTPSFLSRMIQNGNISIRDLAPATIDADELSMSGILSNNPIEVLYQTGYLTIKRYDEEYNEYCLDYPNEEVKDSFFRYLLKSFIGEEKYNKGLSVQDFAKELRGGQPEKFVNRLNSLFAGLGYSEKDNYESRFQDALYLLFTLLGTYARVEERTSDGRIDLFVESNSYIYIFECKVNSDSTTAMEQIKEKQYWLPYINGNKKIFLIGINYDSKIRRINDYIIEEVK
ncbi:MAG: ATP-binding protein [Muribaculaceae bacterium]|nr:ATP-binding protein [Muribaculaceae bacterium]